MDTYYKCPHCNKESEVPGFCRHGKATVAMKLRHVVKNPINNAPYLNGRLVGVHDGWVGELATGETESRPTRSRENWMMSGANTTHWLS